MLNHYSIDSPMRARYLSDNNITHCEVWSTYAVVRSAPQFRLMLCSAPGQGFSVFEGTKRACIAYARQYAPDLQLLRG